jgi:PPOX class probable F420-dependent enzyme
VSIPSDPWWREFLAADPPHTAKVATTRADGRPHVAPVWITLDADDILFTTGANSLKGKALRREARVALCIDDERPPFSFVIVEGIAALSDDVDEVLRWATAIGGRYMGPERADEFGRRNGVPGELLVRVTPTHVVAAQGISDS